MGYYETIIAFFAIVILIVILPGPNLFLLIRTVIADGSRAGLSVVLGICVAILCHATMAFVGLSAMIAASPTLFVIVKGLGAAYLIALGIKTVIRYKSSIIRVDVPTNRGAAANMTLGHFVQGWLSNILNPAPLLFYVSTFPQLMEQSETEVMSREAMVLAGFHILAALAWYGLLAVALQSMQTVLQKPHVFKLIQVVCGLLLVAFGVGSAISI